MNSKHKARQRLKLSAVAIALSLSATMAHAEFDGPRTYWSLPQNTNIVSAHYVSGVANVAWTNWSRVQPNVDLDTTVFLVGYTRVQPIFGRTVFWQATLPSATIRTSSVLPVPTNDTFVNGLGDLAIGGTMNLYGAPGMRARDWVRNDLDLEVNLGASIHAPTGQYDADEALNVGSNQWKARVSLPIVKSIGQWVPGKRTTLEIMPAVMLFGDNNNAQGNRIKQDPLYSVEAHLTRDLMEGLFLSLDYTWLEGGEETFKDRDTGVVTGTSRGVDANLMGATLSFEINDNFRLFLTHMQTLGEKRSGLTMEGSLTKISFTWSWHDILQRVRDFKE